MFRTRLTRLMTLGAALFLVGCSSSRGGLCSTCGDDRPGLFSRFRTASRSEGVMMGGGECCDRTVSGPILPAAPATVLPPPQPGVVPPAPLPNGGIPPIQDAPQKNFDYNKMNTRTGIKTNIQTAPTKEGF